MAEPLKVMHVVRAFETGGLETLVLETCARMAARTGLEACAVGMLPGDGLDRRPRYAAVPSLGLNGSLRRGKLAMVRALNRLFRRERPDVVHVHNFLAQLYAGVAAKMAGVPALVGTKHGAGWPRLCGSRRLAGRVYRLCDRIIAVSGDVQRGFVGTYGLPTERVPVILNGIDTDKFRPHNGSAGVDRLECGGAPMIGTVCRLVEYKGVRTLLNAFAMLRDRFPDARLVIVGDGVDRGAFEQCARKLGIGDSVQFLGAQQNVEDLYPIFDVFALASHTEGISLTVLEAGACALPIVATRVGGNPEIVRHGREGLLVPPRDAEGLADALERQWTNRAAAEAMGRAARERVVREFSLDRMTSDYVELYKEMLRAKRREAAAAS